MPFLILLLILAGIFYFLVLPVLVFVSLGKPEELRRRLRMVEAELAELRYKFNKVNAVAPVETKPSQSSTVNAAVVAPPLPKPVAVQLPPKILVPVKPAAPIAAAKPPPATFTPKPADPGAEITLGARWATRLGIGFLVIAVVSFGIYISQFSNPPIRLLEVVVVAAGVTGLGGWLERQAKEFGEAIFAGGLALFYFAAFAAHVIAAMRVIPEAQIGLGLLVQYAAVAAIAGIAWWLRRPQVATMAVTLGLVSCFFAQHRDQLEISLSAALGLAAVGAFLRVMRGWGWPAAAGYVGAQICYLGSVLVTQGFTVESYFAHGIFIPATTAGAAYPVLWPGYTLAFPTMYFVLLLGADIWAQSQGRQESAVIRTGATIVAAVLYGLGGWWGGAVVGGGWASDNLLAAAIACLVAGVIYQRRHDMPEIYEILIAAAGAWLAIYFINEYTGWIRWLALLLESFIFAWRVRGQGSPLAWVCMAGTWLGSGFAALTEAIHVTSFADHWDAAQLHPISDLTAWDVARWKLIFWPLISVVLWGWLEKSPRAAKDIERQAIGVGSALTALGAMVFGTVAWIAPAQSWLFLVLGLVVTTATLLLRSSAGWPTGVLAMLLSLWFYHPAPNAETATVVAALGAFTAVAVFWTGLFQSRAAGEKWKKLGIAAEVAGFLSLLYAWVQGFDAINDGGQLLSPMLATAALALAVMAWRGPWRATGDIAWGWAMVGLIYGDLNHLGNFDGPPVWCCFGAALILGWLTARLSTLERPAIFLLHPKRAGLVLPGFVYAGWAMLALPQELSQPQLVLALAGFATLYACIGRANWLPGGGFAAVLLTVVDAIKLFDLPMFGIKDLRQPAVLATSILLQGWLATRRHPEWPRHLRDILLLLTGAAALFVFDVPAYRMADPSHQYVTLYWAGAGAALFIAGLAARLRSYRYAGLAGLALCVPRVFFVDITDQFERILAFGGLALVLLAIGFSYHKLRRWLVALDGDEPPAPQTPSTTN